MTITLTCLYIMLFEGFQFLSFLRGFYRSQTSRQAKQLRRYSTRLSRGKHDSMATSFLWQSTNPIDFFCRKSKQNFKGIGTTLLLIGAFLLLNMPPMILYIMQSVNKTLEVGGTWGNVFGILAASTGIVDVCIYAGRNADVQGVFKSQKSRSIRCVLIQSRVLQFPSVLTYVKLFL